MSIPDDIAQRAYADKAKHLRKKVSHEEIERQVAEYLAKGNKIEPAVEFEATPSRRAY